jgi:ribosomal protein S18 acetylase RimI-like enzyme
MIRPIDSGEVNRAADLVLENLAERWGFLDLFKNPDLIDITASYATGVFLVAILDDQIIGTGALLPEDEFTCRIVRMSVKKELRRQGVGSALLKELLSIARRRRYLRVVLETTATWEDAVKFYTRHGFDLIEERKGDVYFELWIS